MRMLLGFLCLAPWMGEAGETTRNWDYPCGCEWRSAETEGSPSARHENAFVSDGERFYLIGGRGNKAVDIFDPVTGRWTEGAAPPLEIHHFQPVLHEGRIYVLGAMTGGFPRETPLDRVLIYDPAEDAWEWGATIPEGRRRGAGGAVNHAGTLYWVSGIVDGHWDDHVPWLDAFDPNSGEWTQLPDAPRARDHFQAAVVDGKLYAAGGRRSSHREGEGGSWRHVVPQVDVYDIDAERWSTLSQSDLPTPRAGTATVDYGRFVIVLGGETWEKAEAHAEVEALDTQTGQWHSFPSLTEPRHGTGAVVHNHALYIAAGNRTRGGGAESNTMDRLALGPPDQLVTGADGLSRTARIATDASAVSFSFSHVEGDTGLRRIERSADLQNWEVIWRSDDPSDVASATQSDDGEGARALRVEIPLSEMDRGFLRLRSGS